MIEIGKITKKDFKEDTTTNPPKWKRWTFVVNGKTFSTFDTEHGQFNEGADVQVDYYQSKDGKYNNINSMIVNTSGVTQQITQTATPTATTNPILQPGKYLVTIEKVE
uniref:Uncharacterized protein n=1 Tax=viral metagenome TaxID=1070528 RepID=A0A6M3LVD0_9ZZZZ